MSRIKSIKQKTSNHFTFNGVEVFVKDALPKGVEMKNIVKKLFKSVPSHLIRDLDIIYVGQFPELTKRDLNAMYQDSSIFVSNECDAEDSMLDDLIHEVAHCVEDNYGNMIYGDGKVEKEFLNKRKQLWSTLKDEGLDVELTDFVNSDFDHKFDEMLYLQIGYPMLSIYTVNLFYSPYGATSLREYFANGFEAFFMREDINRLKNVSPLLYNKIINLLNLQNGEKK